MEEYKWDEKKNQELKQTRGVSFEEILNSKFLGAEKHAKRENQIVLLFEYKDYIWIVPSVVEEKYIFLKNIIPKSQIYTKIYKR
ncbi:MAG: toxin [Candidatus Scalindua sp.]